jgi:ATP-dependent RNA helicase RhlE
VLVLVPTREIAIQVQNVMGPYLREMGLYSPALVIGGVSFGPQIQALRRNPPVIIATPGRLNDHLSEGKLKLRHVTALVLDEADRMLDMGFLPQVRQVLRHLSEDRQTLLFSATMPPDLKSACRELLRDPEQISVDSPNTANVDIEQRMQEVDMKGKQDALLEALNAQTESVLVFARTKRRTDRVAEFLENYGMRAERIHGDRSQMQRQNAINLFRSGKVKVLVATDIAARGLDIPLVELVVNYDLPEAKEDYVHRIGRTGRAGAKGVALSFVTPEERGHWASITGQKRPHKNDRPSREQLNRQERGEGRSERPFKKSFKKDFRSEGRSEHSERPQGGRPQGKFKKWGAGPQQPEAGQRYNKDRPQKRSFSGSDRFPQERSRRPDRNDQGVRPVEGEQQGWSDAPREGKWSRENRNPRHVGQQNRSHDVRGPGRRAGGFRPWGAKQGRDSRENAESGPRHGSGDRPVRRPCMENQFQQKPKVFDGTQRRDRKDGERSQVAGGQKQQKPRQGRRFERATAHEST